MTDTVNRLSTTGCPLMYCILVMAARDAGVYVQEFISGRENVSQMQDLL